ncbi:MAG: NADH-quinone oxidoreductase subunit J [Actinomycetes bacterium]
MNLLAAVTIPDVAIFVLSAALSLAGAIGILMVKNPVHAALSLVMTLFGIAVAFIELQADFLAAVQIIVYAGAIVVLFLFVIMFLGVDKREDLSVEPIVGQRPTAVLLVVGLMASIIALGIIGHFEVGPLSQTAELTGGAGNVADLGRAVFTTYLFAFEATAGLLVIAVIGAVVLARKSDVSKSVELQEVGEQ